MSIKQTNRVKTLDYLRGLAAFGIMIYHYSSWTFGRFSSDTVMERVGIYGVSIFYVLSGLTLFHVYFNKLKPDIRTLKAFYIKRFFRIFPLLWVVTILTILLSRKIPDAVTLFLNFTGLFGLVKWDAYLGTGVWSIGNELVFYLFFPVMVFLTKKRISLFYVLALTLLLIYLFFAFHILDNSYQLSTQWTNYINPLNQVFLFLSGYLIGFFFSKSTFPRFLNTSMLICAALAFVLYPVEGGNINLVVGYPRVVFTLICCVVCLSCYKLFISLPPLIDRFLTIFGEASYSIYLLHPIVWSVTGLSLSFVTKYLFFVPKNLIQFPVSIILTLVGSYWLYLKFEKIFMRKGREIAQRITLYPRSIHQ